VKIKFLDNTFQQIAFDQYMLAQEMVEEIGAKLGLDQAKALDYGLLLEFPSEEEDAQDPSAIESYLKSSMSSPVHLPSSTSAPVSAAAAAGLSSGSTSAVGVGSLPLTSSVSHNAAATMTITTAAAEQGSTISGRAKPPRPPRPVDIKPAPRPVRLMRPGSRVVAGLD
jgi:hypothetical protein